MKKSKATSSKNGVAKPETASKPTPRGFPDLTEFRASLGPVCKNPKVTIRWLRDTDRY